MEVLYCAEGGDESFADGFGYLIRLTRTISAGIESFDVRSHRAIDGDMGTVEGKSSDEVFDGVGFSYDEYAVYGKFSLAGDKSFGLFLAFDAARRDFFYGDVVGAQV